MDFGRPACLPWSITNRGPIMDLAHLHLILNHIPIVGFPLINVMRSSTKADSYDGRTPNQVRRVDAKRTTVHTRISRTRSVIMNKPSQTIDAGESRRSLDDSAQQFT